MRRTAIERFMQICKKDKFELKDYLEEKLKTKYDVVINGDGFLYAKGTIPFALTAHMDTVHKERVKQVVIENDKKTNHRIVSSPQGIGGDDRCGIYMILRIIDSGLLPTIIFCEDEEIGCVGSSKFAETEYVNELSDVNYIIELDRKGNNDAVFYDCDNPEFTKYITEKSGYTEAWGSMSDISVISPECMTASVNFSCGYYNPHTLQEYVDFEEMLATTEMVKTLLRDENAIHYEFVEKVYTYDSYKYGYEDYYGYYGDGFRNNGTSYYDQCDDYKYYMYAEINDNTTKKGYIDSSFCGDSPIECLCKLFFRFPHTTMSDVCYLEFYDADWALLSEMDLADVLQIVKAYDLGDIPVIGNINR